RVDAATATQHSGALRLVSRVAAGRRRWRSPGSTLGKRRRVELHRVANHTLRVGAPAKALHLHRLVFERLVVEEEALELAQPVWRQLSDVRVVRVLRIVHVDGDDLVVLAFFVAHGQHSDRPRAQHAQGHYGFLPEYEDVEWIAVLAVRLRQE